MSFLLVIPSADEATPPENSVLTNAEAYATGSLPQTVEAALAAGDYVAAVVSNFSSAFTMTEPPSTVSYAAFTGTQHVNGFGLTAPTTSFVLEITFRATVATLGSANAHVVSCVDFQIQADFARSRFIISGDSSPSDFATIDGISPSAGDILRVTVEGGDGTGDTFTTTIYSTPSGGGSETVLGTNTGTQRGGLSSFATSLSVFGENLGANYLSGDLSNIVFTIDGTEARNITGADLVGGSQAGVFTQNGAVASA